MKGPVLVLLAAGLVAGCTVGGSPAPATGNANPTPLTGEATPGAAPTVSPIPRPSRSPRPTGAPATVLREIDVLHAGWAMTLAGGALWVQVDPPTDSIVRIDIETGDVTPAIPLGWRAKSGPEGLWVVGGDFLMRADPATGKELARAPVWGHFALRDGFVWVLDEEGLRQLDAETGEVKGTMAPESEVCDDVKDMAIGFDSAWLACKHGSVDRLDLSTGRVTSLPTGRGSHTLLVTADAVWVTNYQAGSTSRIDPATNTVLNIRDVGSGIGITEGGGLVWSTTSTEWVGLDSAGTVHKRLAVPRAGYWYDLVWTEEGMWGSTAGSKVYLIEVPSG